MKIFFGAIQLTDWSDYPAQGVTVNGQAAFEAVDFVRALTKRFFYRGNCALTLQFSVRREFATNRAAQIYLLTHFSALPKLGVCQIICGAPGEVTGEVLMQNAVLTASPSGSFNGVESIVTYTIQAGNATTDVPTDFLLGGNPMILKNKQALGNGVTAIAVVFSTAFPPGVAPVVTASIAKPSGSGANIFATVRDDLVTVNGFTAELSGPTPDALHKLNWIAIGT